ncbi:MAG: 2,3-bisphosphoglycerate-independent phosphoglycerate mutase [Alphaproteobacteria bacterium]|nr:2,3-bisphosphoglycerate-independent phosphoglycerate mutase [Alphaproteobacteria bacterium]
MSEFTPKRKPVVLCILDGWGIGDGSQYDAIKSAKTPCFDSMMENYPNTTLTACGLAVGLPEGQMGNSEVGHMNIGAGRVVMQFLPQISKAFADDKVKDYNAVKALISQLKESGKVCHIMGLLSDGGIHTHIEHISALAKIMGDAGVKTCIHAFTDGRDCNPETGKGFIAQTMLDISAYENISLSTICGRYYAMDRDNRWDRVKPAYDAIVLGKAETSNDPLTVIQKSYNSAVTDEFIEPVVLGDYEGIKPGDAIIFANFRNDRARELLQAMLFDDFNAFERENGKPEISKALGMVEYSDELNPLMETLFLPVEHKKLFGEIVSAHGLKQMRMAETEKYPHVTFFFNCGREEPYEGENRILVNSPKVATYDLQPEMSAPELSEKLFEVIRADKHDVTIVNFANTDMLGHTGNLDAAKKAAETVDGILCTLQKLVLEKGGILLITADHGNADQMLDPNTNGPHTAHSMNPVPFIIIGAEDGLSLNKGKLADIAPTMLHFLGIKQPKEMDGICLIIV